jgi:hypothetical protein
VKLHFLWRFANSNSERCLFKGIRGFTTKFSVRLRTFGMLLQNFERHNDEIDLYVDFRPMSPLSMVLVIRSE